MPDAPRSLDPPDRGRGVFLGDLAHDLSTPLTAIHGATELLLTGTYGTLDGEQRALVGEILASARELRAYVQDIADLGALDTGRLVFASSPFNVAAVVDELGAGFADAGSRRSVGFALEVSLPQQSLVSDERRMRQALSAVCGFLVKSSKRGSRVTGSVSHAGGMLRVELRATGLLLNDDPESLFADRRDATPGMPKPYRGPGLGLPLVRRVLDAWGGRITAELLDGTFVLCLDVPATVAAV